MSLRLCCLFLMLCGVALLGGCGQGEYDARMDSALAGMARRSQAAQGELLMPAHFTVANTSQASQGLKIRLPSVFGQQTTSLDDIPRAKFTAADVPGFLYTMERPLADDAGKQIPAYCYLYSVNKAATPPDTLHSAMQAGVSNLDASAAWTDMPAANGIAVKKLEAKGTMDYELAGAVSESLASKLQLYSFDAGANQVVVGFRAADSVATKHKFFEAVDAAVKTAQLDNPAAAPAPAPMPNP